MSTIHDRAHFGPAEDCSSSVCREAAATNKEKSMGTFKAERRVRHADTGAPGVVKATFDVPPKELGDDLAGEWCVVAFDDGLECAVRGVDLELQQPDATITGLGPPMPNRVIPEDAHLTVMVGERDLIGLAFDEEGVDIGYWLPDADDTWVNLASVAWDGTLVSARGRDSQALSVIARILRDPEWSVGMLEDICDIVKRAGYPTVGDGSPTWDRH